MALKDWIESKPAHVFALEVRVANLNRKDKRFLETIIGLFTDPAHVALADQIRGGEFSIQYNPKNGAPHVLPVEAEKPGRN